MWTPSLGLSALLLPKTPPTPVHFLVRRHTSVVILSSKAICRLHGMHGPLQSKNIQSFVSSLGTPGGDVVPIWSDYTKLQRTLTARTGDPDVDAYVYDVYEVYLNRPKGSNLQCRNRPFMPSAFAFGFCHSIAWNLDLLQTMDPGFTTVVLSADLAPMQAMILM